MAKSENNMLLYGGLAVGGYFLWKKYKSSPEAYDPNNPLADVGSILPDLGSILSPPTSPITPTQTVPTGYYAAVPTPYGPVIPSFPGASQQTAQQQQQQQQQTDAIKLRMQDILYRHQYIYNSIAYGLAYGQSNPQDAGLAARIATLRGKDQLLQEEWGSYTGGKPIPDGQVLNTAAGKAAYIEFLRSHSWCDPLVGVPC